jgi:predicted transcriptional regulator
MKLKPSEKLVLQALAYHYPNVFPSIARIAGLAGVSKATAKRALRKLVKKGLIFKHWRDNRTTVYELKVDRILTQADKHEKKLAQNEPQAQIDPSQDDPLTDIIISTVRDNELTDHASKELENKPQELNAGIEIESDDHPAPASSSEMTEDAQSAVRPSCASAKTKDSKGKDHQQKSPDDPRACQQQPDVSIDSPPAGTWEVPNTSASSGPWVDDGIIADDAEEDTQGNTIETRACPLNSEADLGPEPKAAVTAPQQPAPESPLSKPDQPEAPPTPQPEPKPACQYSISEGPECWFVEDNRGKIVARAATMEQACVKALDMSGKPHDRFLPSKSEGVCKVFDTRGGVLRVVKTCATIEEAIAEAARLSKESEQDRR